MSKSRIGRTGIVAIVGLFVSVTLPSGQVLSQQAARPAQTPVVP